MKTIRNLEVGILIIATLVGATPLHAASDVLDHGVQERRTAAFAGVNMRINLTPGKGSRPVVRLQSGFRHHFASADSLQPAATRQTSMLEIRASRRGEPRLAIGGTDSRQLGRQLGLSTGAKIGIGVLVIVGALAIAVAASPAPDIFGEE